MEQKNRFKYKTTEDLLQRLKSLLRESIDDPDVIDSVLEEWLFLTFLERVNR